MFSETDAFEELVCLTAVDAKGALFCEVNLKTKSHSPILQDASVVPVHRLADYGSKIDDLAFVRPPEISAEHVVLPNVDAIDEAQLSAKIWREVVVVGGEGKMPATVRCISP